MSILSSHAGSWYGDKWYRRAWYIWPQVASLLVVGWLFAGVLLKPNPPWAQPKTEAPPTATAKPPAQPTAPQRQARDETTCSQGNSPDALAACSRLIEANRLGFYFNRAQIYVRNGDYDRAIADLSEYIHLIPNNAVALTERGLSYAKKGEYDRAIADYTEAIRLSHGGTTASDDINRVERAFVKALNDRGLSYAKKDEYDRAIADYTEAIRHDRGSALSYSNRGSAYEKKGELDKALADFREAQNNGSTTAPEDINRVERAIESLRKKYVVDGFSGLSLGARVSFQSADYQEYQCTPSQQFDGVTWCNKQRVEKEARGSYRSSYTIAHSRDGIIDYLNRSLEPAFFNAGEADSD